MESFITEDGLHPEVSSILKTVFLSCNEDNEGAVEVSKFMRFLNEKATSGEVFDYLHVLNEILDPKNVNCSIGWSECERGMQKWIHYVNSKNFLRNVENTSTPLRSLSVNTARNMRREVGMKDFGTRTFSNHSNQSIETSQASLDLSVLTSRLEELETTNNHLLVENHKLKENLNITEDVNGSMLLENEELRLRGEKQQKVLDSNKVELETLYEVKTSVLEYQTVVEEIREKESLLLRENKLLQEKVTNYKTKICQMDTSFELLKVENKKLSDELVNEKDCSSRVDYMNLMVKELTVSNEVLRAQKVNIERELSEMKQDVYHGFSVDGNGNSSFNSSFNGSTNTQPSLFEELTAELNSSLSNNTLGHDTSYIEIEHDCMVLVKECCKMFSEKKDVMLCEIKQLVTKQPKESENILLCIINEWSNAFETCMRRFTRYVQGKHQTEGKLSALSDALKASEEEKRQMNESMDKAIVKLSSLSASSIENQNKMQKLVDEVEKGREELEEAKKENKKITEEMSVLGKTNSEIGEHDESEQIVDLKKLVKELEHRNIEISRQLFDLEEVVTSKAEELAKQQENLREKEDILLSIKTKHETDMVTLLKLIPFSDSYWPRSSSITIDNVVDSLVQFLDKCEHENKRSKGMRDSPDGFDHMDNMKQHQVVYNDEKYTTSLSVQEKVVDEESPPKVEINKLPSRQRRRGVSAEPVTVQWSSFQKYLKPMQMECTEELSEDVHSSTKNVLEVSTSLSLSTIDENMDNGVENKSLLLNGTCDYNIDDKEGSKNAMLSEENGSNMSHGITSTPKDILSTSDDINMSHGITSTPKDILSTSDDNNVETNLYSNINKPDKLENKYRTFLRAFQTDQYTLPQRLEKQQRSRDLSELSFEKELVNFTTGLKEIENSQYTQSHFREKFLFLRKQIEIIRKTMTKVSQQSEQHGCYQQESRASPNMEVTIKYVESLRGDVNRMEEQLALVKENNKLDCPKCNTLDNSSSLTNISGTSFGSISLQDTCDVSDEKDKSDSASETNEDALTHLRNNVCLATVAQNFINTKSRRRVTQFSSEKSKKCVTFNTIEMEKIYSPGEPITTADTFGITSTLCKKLWKVALFFCFFCILFVILYSGLEFKPCRVHEILLRYLPVKVEHSSPYARM